MEAVVETPAQTDGLALLPFRAVRPTVDGAALATRLCPPYDVIDDAGRAAYVAADPHNAVSLVLPRSDDGSDAYAGAARLLEGWLDDGALAVDGSPALYVYEMVDPSGAATRGLVGALELRDPADGVVLPHEDTMAGPVADRLALMQATEANLEMIYLVYDGGGAASNEVAGVDKLEPIATATTPDGVTHRLWALADPAVHDRVRVDLAPRRALIADGHHRYATYRELQARERAHRGPGPWDYGLTLLVDSTTYGPQVHAIHRVLPDMTLADTVAALQRWDVVISTETSPEAGLTSIADRADFAVVLTDGDQTVAVFDSGGRLRAASGREGEAAQLSALDVTVLHRVLVGQVLGLADTVETVGYAHSVEEAVRDARSHAGIAVLLRATPVNAVAGVAAAGSRMPRKSTLFTPKPASGLVMRRFADAD